MRYARFKSGFTVTKSAYCPVCCAKTISLQGEKAVLRYKFDSAYDVEVVKADSLCCSPACLQEYQKKLDIVNKLYGQHSDIECSLLKKWGSISRRTAALMNGVAYDS